MFIIRIRGVQVSGLGAQVSGQGSQVSGWGPLLIEYSRLVLSHIRFMYPGFDNDSSSWLLKMMIQGWIVSLPNESVCVHPGDFSSFYHISQETFPETIEVDN